MVDPEAPEPRSSASFLVSQLAVIEQVIRFTCSRHALTVAEIDEFSSHVKLKLIENDYRILRQFQGRSNFRTYISIVIQRLFLDCRIAAWGKWRPSAAARRGGAVAILLERLLARDGYTFEEACELLTTNHCVTMSRSELEAIAGTVAIPFDRRPKSEDALVNVAARDAAPDVLLAQREADERARRIGAVLRREIVLLPPDERLIVLMRFEDGRTVAEIARILRLDQKSTYRRLEAVLRRLREALETNRLDAGAVLDLLEGRLGIVDCFPDEAEFARSRPSIRSEAMKWRQ
jgi:RNA polymerase sigma factor for flagellar operon FliA